MARTVCDQRKRFCVFVQTMTVARRSSTTSMIDSGTVLGAHFEDGRLEGSSRDHRDVPSPLLLKTGSGVEADQPDLASLHFSNSLSTGLTSSQAEPPYRPERCRPAGRGLH